jgi:glyoxylate/hydroxypyruvate reductase A
MRTVFYYEGADAELWLAGLRAQLPGASVEHWVDGAAPADYAVAWAPPQRLVDQQTGLKAIFNIGAGVDRLLQLRLPRQLQVVRLDDAGMAVQMAEYVCHALIRHFREFDCYEEQARSGRWAQRESPLRSDFPVGLMGLGVLGERVARAIRQFEFPLNGWSRTAKQIEGMRCFAGPAGLHDFLAATRVLVCLLPLTADTREILCRDTLSRLPRGAYVINVARGSLLVEDHLLELLDSGHLAGAALDVFRAEPLAPGHALWRHPKVRVTPHISAQTLCGDSIAQIAGKIIALEHGLPVAGIVDLARGY